MADNRTGLSPADIAESFRDRCGDGSVEWVYTPMQAWVLLDAADMLDENARLREEVERLQAARDLYLEMVGFVKDENDKLRSICAEVAGILFNLDVDYCGLCDRDGINHPCPVHTVKGGECLIENELRELGVVE